MIVARDEVPLELGHFEKVGTKKFRGLWPTGPRLEARAKHDRILPLAGLDILGRPKGENKTK